MTADEPDSGGATRAAARALFGGRLPLAQRYHSILSDRGVALGLIGPSEIDRLWERHILNCAIVTDLVPRGCTLIDVGSGAGLPGIVIAIRRPDVEVTLIESMSRRAAWLQSLVTKLNLENVVVRRARAEELAGVVSAECVAARAVAPLGRLLTWTWPLCRPGGRVLALKGQRAEQEIAQSRRWLQAAGARDVSIEELGQPDEPWSARVVVVGKPTGSDRSPVNTDRKPIGRVRGDRRRPSSRPRAPRSSGS